MSKSYKKNAFCGFTNSTSEKKDKKQYHKRLRRKYNSLLDNFDPDTQESIYLDENEVANTCLWSKDGKQYIGDLEDTSYLKKCLRK